MQLRDIPNLVSLLRVVLVGPVVYTLLIDEYSWALVLFALAGVSDGLDGFLAKHYGWESRLGKFLDPLADKLLLVSCYVVLGMQHRIPAWLVALVILRDVVIVVGALVYHFHVEQVDARPTIISKLNTAAQILLVIVTLLHYGFFPLPETVQPVLVAAVTVTVLWSGAGYVWTWSRRASHSLRGQRTGPAE